MPVGIAFSLPASASRLLKGICLLAALASSVAAQTNPPTAPDPDERVEVIMSDLPPQGTPAYRSLIRSAGDAKGQMLPITKCEVWSVRRRHLDILKREARKRNVGVREVGGDWNHVLRPMDRTQPMGGAAKSMMDTAMKSDSTAGVGMMEVRAANMVEYALTKGMNDKTGAHPMTVRIAVNAQTAITAVRRSVEIKGNRCVWRGVVEGTEQPVTIMWWGTGRITGTIHNDNRIYQLRQMDNGVIGIVETMLDKMPDEHPRMSGARMRELKMREDEVFNKGDASMARPKRGDTKNQEDDAAGRGPSGPGRRSDRDSGGARLAAIAPKPAALPPPRKGTNATKATVIDVLVVYTAKAAQHYGDIKLDLIELAVEDTNKSFRDSGIKGVEVRVVHKHQTDYDEARGEHFDHVWRMVDRDGYMEEVPVLRDRYRADVVVLVVDNNKGCGLATRVAADPNEAYAVVHHECAATIYSFAHEIGHIIGARHDRLLDQSTSPFPFGHGFVAPDLKWRTMMSYKRGCNGCPRLPIWSTPASIVQGQQAGSDMHDNARVIRENVARVASFR